MAKHFTIVERGILYRMKRAGKSIAEITETLGRHRSTIYRELNRNTGQRGYRPRQAQRLADERRSACRGLKDLLVSLRRTMTLDNGKEFAEHHRLTDKLGTDVYFADPYASWQRGLNENTNGLLQQFFPKGTGFSQVSHKELARVERLLNQRPRKSLGY